MKNLDLHKKIDALTVSGPEATTPDEVRQILRGDSQGQSQDAVRYFYTNVDSRWLDWLWSNRFLDKIKEKSQDPTRYSYQTAELTYLVNVVEKEPEKVSRIILEVPISKDSFNPEVVDRFLWITSKLPAKQIGYLAEKIRSENWPKLMAGFNRWGFEYEKIFEKLTEAKDYTSLIKIAEAVLTVRTAEDIAKTSNGISTDNPFYFTDLGHTQIFERLAAVNESHLVEAFALVTKVMSEVVLMGKKESADEIFTVRETFYLSDVDFFTLEVGEERHISYRDDVRDLAATVKLLAVKAIGKKSDEPTIVKDLYKKYIESLPDSQSMWRLRLFVMSLCPEIFKNELEKALFRIFENKKASVLIMGTEYEKTIKKSFFALDKEKQNEFVLALFKNFGEAGQEEWRAHYGWAIASSINDFLSEPERQEAEKLFKRALNASYEPSPTISRAIAGSIRSKGPVSIEEFNLIPVVDIASRLKEEWSPENLPKLDKEQNFYNPLDAEGLAETLRMDIKKRLADYLNNSELFFDRQKVDPHYTYSFFRGIQESIKEKIAGGVNWDNLITTFQNIVESGREESFDKIKRKKTSTLSWLANWGAVHSAMSDVLQELLRGDDKPQLDFSKYRNTLLNILDYLLEYPDPIPKDESAENGDLFTMAINTVRGRAFEAFNLFVYQDSKHNSKNEGLKISSDVKILYEKILEREDTQSIKFMFGHYLPFYYFRDQIWVGGLIEKVFPTDPLKKDLYLAAWEGYLSTNVYKEMFEKFTSLYKRGIDYAGFKKKSSFKDMDDGLATHLALAFVHFPEFDFQNELFIYFWSKEHVKRQKEFFSFIGRYVFSKDKDKNWFESQKVDIEKLKKLWDWALENISSAETLNGFGYWLSPENNVFDTKWLAEHVRKTLQKTKGDLEWEYGLMHLIDKLAKESPEDTLEIVRLFLGDPDKFDIQHHASMYIEQELLSVLKILYQNPNTKQPTYDLIDSLIPIGGGRFWKFKEALEN